MTFKLDVTDNAMLTWRYRGEKAVAERDIRYRPTFFVAPPECGDEEPSQGEVHLRDFLDSHPEVSSIDEVEKRPFFGEPPTKVLAVKPTSIRAVESIAESVRHLDRPGTYRCYNVDLEPGFRYCLDCNHYPHPTATLDSLTLSIPRHAQTIESLDELTIDGDTVADSPIGATQELNSRLTETDPDVLVVNTGELIPLIAEAGTVYNEPVPLSRVVGLEGSPAVPSDPLWYETLAGESTYTSYGTTHHSPARYNVLGRVVVDESNTHLYDKVGLEGCLDLVKRTQKPLQEIVWESIGSILTSLEIREASSRNVLVPFYAQNYEMFKTTRTLHNADRGGHIFSPQVGVHSDVHELDFASLYPNIICTRNISPETILCDCHQSRSDIPELDYNVCETEGYLPRVLSPLVEDREDLKAEQKAATTTEHQCRCEAKIDALKWILVSSFGYQGFSNAKFGRIECHEAINACARDILLTAKETIEQNGWRVLHGIVDSLWITAHEDATQTPIDQLCTEITDEVGIRLEYEDTYEWIAFLARKSSPGGSLNRYFGKVADSSGGDDGFVIKGIEYRQDSTPEYIKNAQRSLIETLDQTRSPKAVCDVSASYISSIQDGKVPPSQLLVTERPTKTADEYTQTSPLSAAVTRAESLNLPSNPGQPLTYLVVDTDDQLKHRVRLSHEPLTNYDADYYTGLLKQATESVLAPYGWSKNDFESALDGETDSSLFYYS